MKVPAPIAVLFAALMVQKDDFPPHCVLTVSGDMMIKLYLLTSKHSKQLTPYNCHAWGYYSWFGPSSLYNDYYSRKDSIRV